MSNNAKVFLATIGHGIWRSKNGGVNWTTRTALEISFFF